MSAEDQEFVKGACPQCQGHFEFPKTGIGMQVECPHCRQMITPAPMNVLVQAVTCEKPEPEPLMKDFSTTDGKVFGRFARSPNREFLLIWRDEWAGGCSRTKGPFYLLRGGKELCKGLLKRPNDGHVADNGSFVLCDWLFTEKLASAFYAFNHDGEVLLEKKFRANLYNAAISPDGSFAACQTAINPASRHSELLTLFDLRSRTEVWHLSPPFWPETYEFNVPNLELTIRSGSPLHKSYVLNLSAPSRQ
jgi:hypothetical protein